MPDERDRAALSRVTEPIGHWYNRIVWRQPVAGLHTPCAPERAHQQFCGLFRAQLSAMHASVDSHIGSVRACCDAFHHGAAAFSASVVASPCCIRYKAITTSICPDFHPSSLVKVAYGTTRMIRANDRERSLRRAAVCQQLSARSAPTEHRTPPGRKWRDGVSSDPAIADLKPRRGLDVAVQVSLTSAGTAVHLARKRGSPDLMNPAAPRSISSSRA